jgi:GTP-binding protein
VKIGPCGYLTIFKPNDLPLCQTFFPMIKKAVFLTSNSDYTKCPPPDKPEFAFIGRSNVGKSSLINMLTNHKGLAKTSQKPGKTQLINHFHIDDKWYMVDLPGYGFAVASKAMKATWEKMIRNYLTKRVNLAAIFVLIDSRLEPQKIDLEFIIWCGENGIPFVLVFTKADKKGIEKSTANARVFLDKAIEIFGEEPQYFITSAEKKEGREELSSFIEGEVREYLESKK